jgi:hypothetical protein
LRREPEITHPDRGVRAIDEGSEMKSIATAAAGFLGVVLFTAAGSSAAQALSRDDEIAALKSRAAAADSREQQLQRRDTICTALLSNSGDAAEWKYFYSKRQDDAVLAHEVRSRLQREVSTKKIDSAHEHRIVQGYEADTRAQVEDCRQGASLDKFELLKAQQKLRDLNAQLASLVASTACTWRLKAEPLGPGMNGATTVEKLKASYSGLTAELVKSHATIKVAGVSLDIGWDEPPACVTFGPDHRGDFKLRLSVAMTGQWDALNHPILDVDWNGFQFHPVGGRDIELSRIGSDETVYTVTPDNAELDNPYLYVNIYRLGAIAAWHYERVK